MIEGIKVHIDSADLKVHCVNRARFHEQKAEHYAKQVQVNAEQETTLEANLSNSPVTSLRASEKAHLAKAAWFSTVAKYLAPNETFVLTTGDLSTLELV